MVGRCGCDVAVDVMSVVVGMSNAGEGILGEVSAPFDLSPFRVQLCPSATPAGELPPPAAPGSGSSLFQVVYGVDADKAVLIDSIMFPNLLDQYLDQEGTTWKIEGSEKRWARFAALNNHVPGLTTAYTDGCNFMQVVNLMRASSNGLRRAMDVRHGWEAVDFEGGVDGINEDNILTLRSVQGVCK